jgi:hypothetical protein
MEAARSRPGKARVASGIWPGSRQVYAPFFHLVYVGGRDTPGQMVRVVEQGGSRPPLRDDVGVVS